MKHTNTTIQAYAENYTESVPPLLAQIHQETYAQVPLPQMLSGHLQGRVLAAFSHAGTDSSGDLCPSSSASNAFWAFARTCVSSIFSYDSAN
jgi:hypothetical protein